MMRSPLGSVAVVCSVPIDRVGIAVILSVAKVVKTSLCHGVFSEKGMYLSALCMDSGCHLLSDSYYHFISEESLEDTCARCENIQASLVLFRSLIRISEGSLEDTCARCGNIQASLVLFRSLIRIFASEITD